MDVGLRPGEIFGLHGHRVDFLRGRLTVVDVMTRQGLRQWPKSKKSHRTVPVPPHVLEGMSVLMAGRARNALVFTAPQGGPVTDEHFRDRVWYPAVAAARLCGHGPARETDDSARCRRDGCGDPQHFIRRFAPRIMRHTAASWLVQDGVPLYDVQAPGAPGAGCSQQGDRVVGQARGRVGDSVIGACFRALGAPVAHGRGKAGSS